MTKRGATISEPASDSVAKAQVIKGAIWRNFLFITIGR